MRELGLELCFITENASFVEDLGADSLDTVELVMAFEEKFDIHISGQDAEELYTVGDVIRYLRRRVSE